MSCLRRHHKSDTRHLKAAPSRPQMSAQVLGATVDSVTDEADRLVAVDGPVVAESVLIAEGLAAEFADVWIGTCSTPETCRTGQQVVGKKGDKTALASESDAKSKVSLKCIIKKLLRPCFSQINIEMTRGILGANCAN